MDLSSHLHHSICEYINTWIKIKQEADGWTLPEVERDPSLQIQYMEEFRRLEGVIFDPAEIERNEGRRTFAKLMANSFWDRETSCIKFQYT